MADQLGHGDPANNPNVAVRRSSRNRIPSHRVTEPLTASLAPATTSIRRATRSASAASDEPVAGPSTTSSRQTSTNRARARAPAPASTLPERSMSSQSTTSITPSGTNGFSQRAHMTRLSESAIATPEASTSRRVLPHGNIGMAGIAGAGLPGTPLSVSLAGSPYHARSNHVRRPVPGPSNLARQRDTDDHIEPRISRKGSLSPTFNKIKPAGLASPRSPIFQPNPPGNVTFDESSRVSRAHSASISQGTPYRQPQGGDETPFMMRLEDQNNTSTVHLSPVVGRPRQAVSRHPTRPRTSSPLATKRYEATNGQDTYTPATRNQPYLNGHGKRKVSAKDVLTRRLGPRLSHDTSSANSSMAADLPPPVNFNGTTSTPFVNRGSFDRTSPLATTITLPEDAVEVAGNVSRITIDEDTDELSLLDHDALDGVKSEAAVLDEEEEEYDETMVDRMRSWRNDAMAQHLYSTAEFWGSKALAMTCNANDAFWLAQVHFLTHQYARAEKILSAPRVAIIEDSVPAAGASMELDGADAPLYTAQKGKQRADNIDHATVVYRLTDKSIACRYLCAQCHVRLGDWQAALDLLGEENPWRNRSDIESGANVKADGGIKFEASMCHLRGLVHLHHNATDRAKQSFMEALSLDVKCFESFEVLTSGSMMTPDEEWEFIQGLSYRVQMAEDGDFARMMYTVRLKKYKHKAEIAQCRQRLAQEYGLADDPDVLFGLADTLYAASLWQDCYEVTSRTLDLHDNHEPTMPLHLACMQHLPHLRSRLFILAHDLVDRLPDSAISWYAVGLWYYAGRRWEESRRYFGKSVLLDNRFGPAWLAFAHSYALEGEHDQATTAYSTAQRHFQGTHVPLLCIGMQHLQLGNNDLAEEYLDAAYAMCKDDPHLTNERGVLAYNKQRFTVAVELFEETLRLARDIQGPPSLWISTVLNLGHAHRMLNHHEQAASAFREVIQLDSQSSAAWASLGMVQLLLHQRDESIESLHIALSLNPADQVSQSLLKIALQDMLDAHPVKDISTQVRLPGLHPQTGRNLDKEVAQFEERVAQGRFEEDEAPAEESHLVISENILMQA
ncbi:uncharacterized protein L969DRAFT_88912 [Mixia osmundae IAM 14324]|uniref:Uncharacterized protein n=1 Tax=Mixia osmundae (strain CBS 9802 / IAM 14324 / JCM 22182 / KY 12970) TaxID=764103 RepID=G7E7R3_MIXOS|nr:uncharacterized protein L969DRAFT_88912 [Mixia osmundae IAM 14324]KEI38473.1 hypothetical protein L969DRAFT_88912 [Mixia osmundae IAM 14324]GAA98873.1 hypothetical protein E5Q_05561 [Mixia osmundae IAM 14324]